VICFGQVGARGSSFSAGGSTTGRVSLADFGAAPASCRLGGAARESREAPSRRRNLQGTGDPFTHSCATWEKLIRQVAWTRGAWSGHFPAHFSEWDLTACSSSTPFIYLTGPPLRFKEPKCGLTDPNASWCILLVKLQLLLGPCRVWF
jgi:hypothetical protein